MKKIFLLLAVLCFVSCKKEEKVPEYIIQPEVMAEILVDIHLLEVEIDLMDLDNDSSKLYYNTLEYDLITNKYQLDTGIYKKSFKYYTRNLNEFGKVYDMVRDTLGKKETLGI